eukprot:6975946-Prymnesium_polylepis.1
MSGAPPTQHGMSVVSPGSRAPRDLSTRARYSRCCPWCAIAWTSLCATFLASFSSAVTVLSAALWRCGKPAAVPPSCAICWSASTSTSSDTCSEPLSSAVPAMKASPNSAAKAGWSQTGGGLA